MKVKIRKLTNGFCVIIPVVKKPNLNNIKSARQKNIVSGELWHEVYVDSRVKALKVINESGVVTKRHGNYPAFL